MSELKDKLILAKLVTMEHDLPNLGITDTGHTGHLSLLSDDSRPKKAALLIGCRYEHNRSHHTLIEPHNDVHKVKNLLMSTHAVISSPLRISY